MQDLQGIEFPRAVAAIYEESRRERFDLNLEPRTGCLLRTLASSKPGGAFLESRNRHRRGNGVDPRWHGR